jgi:protein-S-isoprenylcysteine O-methyltransferase Ste14
MKWFLLLLSCWVNHDTHAFAIGSTSSVVSNPLKTTRNELLNHSKFQQKNKLIHSRSALNMIGAAAEITTIALPKLSTIIATSLTPTLLGFYKYEYGVSYAYGTATALTAALVLRSLLSSTVSTPFACMAQLHALAIVFYGIRLNIFLLYRELFLERFRKMRERIEEKQSEKREGGGDGLINRLTSRAPFVLSCSILYAGLVYPALVSAKMSSSIAAVTTSTNYASLLYKFLVCCTWFGFGLGAIGDFNKSLIKGMKGADHLVTGGVFRFFRHPNYTGEMIGWTASFFASIASVFASSNKLTSDLLKSLALPLVTGLLSMFGILFVLLAATTNLELKQKEKYGERDDYVQWMNRSWKGFTLGKKKDESKSS